MNNKFILFHHSGFIFFMVSDLKFGWRFDTHMSLKLMYVIIAYVSKLTIL